MISLYTRVCVSSDYKDIPKRNINIIFTRKHILQHQHTYIALIMLVFFCILVGGRELFSVYAIRRASSFSPFFIFINVQVRLLTTFMYVCVRI